MLVDAGGSLEAGGPDPGQRTLAPLLRRTGIRSLDLVVVSHPHPDHLGGFAYLAQHFAIGELWWNGAGEELPAMQALFAAVRKHGGAIHTSAELPRRLERGGITIEVLHPRPGPESDGLPYDPAANENDNAMVLRLVYGERSILLAGDIETGTEARLAPTLLPTDVLKVPHHGSRTSSTAALLDALQPHVAIISVGFHNTFGFPAPDVLERFRSRGVTVLETDLDGMVEVRTDGRRLLVRGASGRRVDF
jgi:competence protein ComEC